MKVARTFVVVCALSCGTRAALAETPVSDIAVGYSFMRITEVTEGGVRKSPTFMRHNLAVAVGIDAFSFGLVYQRATKSAETIAGTPEDGLMLTVGYDRLLVDHLRLEALVRVGVSGDTDSSQPLYATDTDLQLKLVTFDAEGWGPINNPIFPTATFGTIVNRFGRVQLTGGVGAWWWGFSTFVSGLYALNGVEDPRRAGPDDADTYASLANASVTVSLAYDLDLSASTQLHFEARKNFGLTNAGNDLVGVVQFKIFFEEAFAEDDRFVPFAFDGED